MADATYAVPHFLGGEISQFAQGRFDKPEYRASLNVCLNGYPREGGAWTRRSGTLHAGMTRAGLAGRVMEFDFESSGVTLEFTDGKMRVRIGLDLLTLGGTAIESVTAANPGVFTSAAAHNFSSTDTVFFFAGPIPTLLQNRQLAFSKVSATEFALYDQLTGLSVDGAVLSNPAGASLQRVLELTTPYFAGTWSKIRAVQAETTAILLCEGIAPQALLATLPSAASVNPAFSLSSATFNDGPYLDPFTNGAQATPGTKSGIVSLTLAFPTYSATKAYPAGSFVTSASINYVSLVDQNVGNVPAASPTFWTATSANAAINDGRGFLGSDVGRAVRLLSEPPAWDVASTYAASTAAAPVVVSYNPSGVPGASEYFESQVGSNTGFAPGADLTHWKIVPKGAAIWTWGRITGLSNVTPRATGANIGDMTGGGGLAAAFDGIFSQSASASSENTVSGFSSAAVSFSSYVGKDYSAATDQIVQQATVYPSADSGFASGTNATITSITLNLRGKATAPAFASDGVLLASATTGNTLSAVTLVSADQVTAWKYVWIEQVTAGDVVQHGLPGPVSYSLVNSIAELSLFNPPGTGIGGGISVEILGPPLLYTAPVTTWRLGLYSATTGFPTCGCWHEGRLWLGGAVRNRFDASVSNGLVPGSSVVNFAPTDQFGTVADNAAISETVNSESANPIFWMKSDLQGVKMGTQAGEFMVLAPTTGPIGPRNITSRPLSNIGSAPIEPCRTEHTTVFVQRYRRKLTEFFPDAHSGKFTGPNLADKAPHIANHGIAEVSYTSGGTPVIWGRCDDGLLFGVTYKRDTLTTVQPPTFAAWHRHALGSGRLVTSLCHAPQLAGSVFDTLTMVTRDPLTGIHHVELLNGEFSEETSLAGARYLDNAVTPSSTTLLGITDAMPYGGVTLNGLWHLNGKTVQVLARGLDCGDRGGSTYTDFLVTDGSLTIPFGDGISAGPGGGLFTGEFFAATLVTLIIVGFTYDSDGQLVRPIAPADTGARNGPALGKTRRNHQYSVLLSNTPLGIRFGGTFDRLRPALLKQANGQPITRLTMFTGVHHDSLDDDYSYDGMVCWRVSRPVPANIVAFSGNIATQDR